MKHAKDEVTIIKNGLFLFLVFEANLERLSFFISSLPILLSAHSNMDFVSLPFNEMIDMYPSNLTTAILIVKVSFPASLLNTPAAFELIDPFFFLSHFWYLAVQYSEKLGE